MKNLIVRVAVESDKDKILNLLNNVFNKQQRSIGLKRENDFWNWKYENNIFEKATIHVIELNGEILAAGTMWPWQFKTGVYILNSYQACDTVVSEKSRGMGLFSMLNHARIDFAKENNADFIYNFPNKNSMPGYLKMGWTFLGELQWYVKVLKPLPFIYSLINKEQSLNLKQPTDLSINDNKLPEFINNNYSPKINVHKVKGFYNWRYKMHPSREYGFISVKNRRKSANAIFTLSKKGNIIEMIIVDYYGHLGLHDQLLDKIVSTAKKINVAIIYTVTNDIIKNNNLIYKGFIPKKNKNLVCFPLNLSAEHKLLDIKNWNLFAGMHDSI